MITRGSPILGNLHLAILNDDWEPLNGRMMTGVAVFQDLPWFRNEQLGQGMELMFAARLSEL